MEHPGRLMAAGVPVAAAMGGEHPQMLLFDRVRLLLAATGLPPLPDVYDLLWRHVAGDDFRLSIAVEAALAAGTLDLAALGDLRRDHCGEVGIGDVTALVAAAHAQASRISERLVDGRSDLADYGRAIADGDAVLNGIDAPTTPAALAALIERLGAATGAMLVANRRMEVELTAAADEAGALRDRLRLAERASVTDPLTGVLNRRGVMAALGEARSDAALPLTVAMVDIDHFKRVNDRWGHVIGDEVLRYVATHLVDGIARVDRRGVVGRLGGEEFIAVLPGVAQGAGVALIDALRAGLAGQLIRRNADGVTLGRVTFSAGVAADRPDEDVDALIGRADAALYTAKRFGRDRVIPDRS